MAPVAASVLPEKAKGKTHTMDEVARHNKEGDAWIVIDGVVFDVTKFAKLHPGGNWVIMQMAGKDATKEFYALHRADVLTKYMRLAIGTIAGTPVPSPSSQPALSEVPYAESSFWQKGFHSPYFNDSHRSLRLMMRAFIEREVMPDAEENEEMGTHPTPELYQKMGQAGILSARIGPGHHMKMPGGAPPNGIKPEDFDYFHELIIHEEISRIGVPGFTDGLGAGLVIGLPPVIRFAQNKELAQRVGTECMTGQKRICLAITDPGAGSDVANISATAERTPCGKFFIVNGIKKWITNGQFADYFTTAVRTGGKGMKGISLLLISRDMPGVTTKPIKTSYSPAAGTAWVYYENVKVPAENLLGEENDGFKCIMDNFNHERWMIVVGVNRASRLLVEECFKWAMQRMVFGQPLVAQPVIRNKLAHMMAQVEAVQAFIDHITHQMNNMNHSEQVKYLAGPIALLKLQATRTAQFIEDESCQIFGGRAITRTGMGQIIERFQRASKFGAILGGSEEIMADLGVKQAVKNFPKTASSRL